MFNMIRFAGSLALLGLVLTGCTMAYGDHGSMDRAVMTDGDAIISTTTSDGYGTHLVTANGMSVYLFKADMRGSGKSACYGKCAQNWPPVLISGSQDTSGALNGMLGTIERKGGSMQVTYNGWPLYRFFKDKVLGDTKGQDVKELWYLVTPQGMPVHSEDEGAAYGGGGGY